MLTNGGTFTTAPVNLLTASLGLLDDIELVAVEKPDTGELAFCSVMGAGGLEYGLLAYRGAMGFLGFALMANEAADQDEIMLCSTVCPSVLESAPT